MTLPSPPELRALADNATPGPWGYAEVDWTGLRSVVINGDDDAIADAFTADARLIALAPDLARRVADLSEWAEQAAEALRHTHEWREQNRPTVSLDHRIGENVTGCAGCYLLARLDEIRGQA